MTSPRVFGLNRGSNHGVASARQVCLLGLRQLQTTVIWLIHNRETSRLMGVFAFHPQRAGFLSFGPVDQCWWSRQAAAW